MMHLDRVVAACLGVAFPIVTGWLLLKGSKESAPFAPSGARVLRFAKAHVAWFYLCLCLFIIGFGSDLFLGKVTPSGAVAFWAVFIGFMALFAAMGWFISAYRVEYDNERIVVHFPAGLAREIQWANVRRISYKKGSGIAIEVRTGKGHTVPSFLPGTDDLLRAAGPLASPVA